MRQVCYGTPPPVTRLSTVTDHTAVLTPTRPALKRCRLRSCVSGRSAAVGVRSRPDTEPLREAPQPAPALRPRGESNTRPRFGHTGWARDPAGKGQGTAGQRQMGPGPAACVRGRKMGQTVREPQGGRERLGLCCLLGLLGGRGAEPAPKSCLLLLFSWEHERVHTRVLVSAMAAGT